MIIPTEIAQAFIEYIDTSYLKYSPHSGSKEEYLSFAKNHMADAFTISWSKGGTSGSCWDEGPEDLQDVYEEDEPSMEQLDKFLEKYFPNLTQEDRYLINNKIESNDTYDGDYYGGSTTQGNKSLKFSLLADELIRIIYDKTDCDLIDFNELLEEHSNIVINMNLDDYPKLQLNKELNKTLINEKINSRKVKL